MEFIPITNYGFQLNYILDNVRLLGTVKIVIGFVDVTLHSEDIKLKVAGKMSGWVNFQMQ